MRRSHEGGKGDERSRPHDEVSLRALLESNEDDNLEFKGETLSRKEIGEYAVALGNEGGGLLVLGVTNRKPRRIVGVAPIPEVEAGRIRDAVLDSTGIRIDLDQIAASEGNVVVITIPSRPAGQVYFTKGGKYLMRSGEGLRGMTLAEIDRIRTSELKYRDVLAEALPGRWDEGVAPVEVERLRTILRAKGRDALARLSTEELLRSLEVVQRSGGKSRMTRAGILLVGSAEALREYVPLHEAKLQRFDRSDLTPTLNEDLRGTIPVVLQRATEVIEAVNTVESFQSGLFRVEIPKFAELAYREGVVNALVHRDYEEPGNVAVRVYRDRLEIANPGGWFGGVNERNILVTESRRRNELLAEALQKIGLVERSALGVKRMFEALLGRKGAARVPVDVLERDRDPAGRIVRRGLRGPRAAEPGERCRPRRLRSPGPLLSEAASRSDGGGGGAILSARSRRCTAGSRYAPKLRPPRLEGTDETTKIRARSAGLRVAEPDRRAASDSIVGRMMRSPSIAGPRVNPSSSTFVIASGPDMSVAAFCASMIRSSGTVDSAARVGATPALDATSRPTRCHVSGATSAITPDAVHTPWNRCCADGMPSRVSTAPPPADCPAIVTRPASPPKLEMFSWTHLSASSQSRTPRLDGASSIQPKPSKPRRYEIVTVTTSSRLNERPSYQGLAGEPAK